MDPELAWQSALGQLQMEMPKASFDTWVRDTSLVSYQEGLFTIGVQNAYARDWLESRLASTVTRLLMGMMDQDVNVQFVVSSVEVPSKESVEAGDNAREPGETKYNGPDEVEIEASYDLAYDEIVAPEHVTLVPRYFLRHLRLIGPDLSWLYLGFRQAAYNTGARSGVKRERFSGKAIAALSGITERTFWNRVADAGTWKRLQGLVTTTEAAPEWDVNSATPRRLPRRYIVAMTLPLTAADARSLRTWLTATIDKLGSLEKTIEVAVEASLEELLPSDTRAQEDDAPETVTAIIRSLFGETISAEHLSALATRLHKHIMPDNDRMGVSHFFTEHILPHLGTGPGWMLTLLRDRCYVNKETGEMRNRVKISGGYAEVASWIGVTPGTIWRWLNGKHSASRGRSKPREGKGKQCGPGRQASEIGKLANPVLRVYLKEIEAGRSGQSLETAPRTFDVLLDEIPMEILEAAFNEQTSRDLDRALASEGDNRAVCSIGNGDIRAVCSIGFARFAEADRAVCRVFKSLNHLNPISNDSPTPLSPSAEARIPSAIGQLSWRGRGNLAFWDFDLLMLNNQVAKAREIRERQKATGANIERLAQGFVSWLLYAYSPSGQRIDHPVALAAKRLLENVHAGAGGDFDCLALLRPFELKALFDQDFAGKLWEAKETIGKDIYTVNYRQLVEPRKRELYRRLFGGEAK